jgi:hypothetical protein
MQDTHQANLPADEAGVAGQLLGSFSRGAKEKVIEEKLVAASECAQASRQRESEQKVRHREQESLLLLQPGLPLGLLALGAVSISAGVITIFSVTTIRTIVHLTTQGLSTAQLNGVHDGAMAGRHLLPVKLTVGGTVVAEDVG